MRMGKLIAIFAVLSAMAFATSAAATTDPLKDMKTKLDSLVHTTSSMNNKLSQQETKLTSHKATMDGITNSVNALTTKVDTLTKTVDDINTKINHQEAELDKNQKSVDDLTKRMASEISSVSTDEVRLRNMSRDLVHHQRSLHHFVRSFGILNNSTIGLDRRVSQTTNKLDVDKVSLDSLTNKVNSYDVKFAADEAKWKNISANVDSQNSEIANMQQILTAHGTSLHQHDVTLSTGEKILGTLNNDMKATQRVTDNLGKSLTDVTNTVGENMNKLKNEVQNLESIGNQLMQQQTFVEERIRSEGMSGIKSLRHIHEGTRSYYGDTHVGGSALSAHDHADYDRTIGLGEFDAVMNGVDFRTRHNDYKFKRPTQTRTFNSVEDIPFPDVPPQVTSKKTVDEQIVEMRKWFKAFKDQDHSVRDYRKYFRANLCYLEGGWTLNAKTLSEPFDSDRHHIDAASWFDLQEKIRFTSYSGSKSNLENFAYLPTMMYNYTNGIPQIAQWNYRILCHPLQQDVPTSYFALQDDLTVRMARKYTWDRMPNTRAARYKLNEFGTDRSTAYTLLDSLMHEIPGKDNYGNNLTDNAFGLLHYDITAKAGTNKVLNVGYYHRWYKLLQKGAMGLQVNHRGFRDENMWVAMTTQPNIMPLSTKRCTCGHCTFQTSRETYAIPLEIVYSTPPYRAGILSISTMTRTPVEFYHDGNTEKDAADTARSAVGVLDKDGHVTKAAPTGFRIITPNIQDVGSVRIRYPIFPVHSEGSPLGEELGALKQMVMKMSRNTNLYETSPLGTGSTTQDADVDFEVRETAKNPPGLHGHDFTLTSAEYKSLMNGTEITVTTSYNLGHNHELNIYYNTRNKNIYIRKCDGHTNCWDGHSHLLRKV